MNCTFTAWNWTNLTAAAKGQVVVYLETEGEQANLTQRIFDVPSLAPDEERTMTVELPLDNATLAALQGAGAPMVKVTLWRPELERSRSETTTALASPPDLA